MADPRIRVQKLKDLLPDVLIKAQGCDEITALDAIRRSVEYLCEMYGFGRASLWFQVGDDDVDEEGKAVNVSFDRATLLKVVRITSKNGGKVRPVDNYILDSELGKLTIPLSVLPSPIEANGHKTGIRIDAEWMPDVDADVQDFELFTKYRKLIIHNALRDLFAVENRPWTSSSGYQRSEDLYDRLLEDYLLKEKFYENSNRAPSCAPPAYANIFC